MKSRRPRWGGRSERSIAALTITSATFAKSSAPKRAKWNVFRTSVAQATCTAEKSSRSGNDSKYLHQDISVVLAGHGRSDRVGDRDHCGHGRAAARAPVDVPDSRLLWPKRRRFLRSWRQAAA